MRVREPTEIMYDVTIKSTNNRTASFLADSIKIKGNRLFVYSVDFGNVVVKIETTDEIIISILLLEEGD